MCCNNRIKRCAGRVLAVAGALLLGALFLSPACWAAAIGLVMLLAGLRILNICRWR
ncbi:MAG: hypothetical protein LBS90_07430 [Oscillospiraceae bacterium]|nr:hypothetical protein [Oscillospiraceae bacterium]